MAKKKKEKTASLPKFNSFKKFLKASAKGALKEFGKLHLQVDLGTIQFWANLTKKQRDKYGVVSDRFALLETSEGIDTALLTLLKDVGVKARIE